MTPAFGSPGGMGPVGALGASPLTVPWQPPAGMGVASPGPWPLQPSQPPPGGLFGAAVRPFPPRRWRSEAEEGASEGELPASSPLEVAGRSFAVSWLNCEDGDEEEGGSRSAGRSSGRSAGRVAAPVAAPGGTASNYKKKGAFDFRLVTTASAASSRSTSPARKVTVPVPVEVVGGRASGRRMRRPASEPSLEARPRHAHSSGMGTDGSNLEALEVLRDLLRKEELNEEEHVRLRVAAATLGTPLLASLQSSPAAGFSGSSSSSTSPEPTRVAGSSAAGRRWWNSPATSSWLPRPTPATDEEEDDYYMGLRHRGSRHHRPAAAQRRGYASERRSGSDERRREVGRYAPGLPPPGLEAHESDDHVFWLGPLPRGAERRLRLAAVQGSPLPPEEAAEAGISGDSATLPPPRIAESEEQRPPPRRSRREGQAAEAAQAAAAEAHRREGSLLFEHSDSSAESDGSGAWPSRHRRGQGGGGLGALSRRPVAPASLDLVAANMWYDLDRAQPRPRPPRSARNLAADPAAASAAGTSGPAGSNAPGAGRAAPAPATASASAEPPAPPQSAASAVAVAAAVAPDRPHHVLGRRKPPPPPPAEAEQADLGYWEGFASPEEDAARAAAANASAAAKAAEAKAARAPTAANGGGWSNAPPKAFWE